MREADRNKKKKGRGMDEAKRKEIVPFSARVLALALVRGLKFTASLIEKALKGEKI